jgi:hypothetical protein
MTFKVGQSGNPAGRPKGALHKTTVDVRQAIARFAQDNVEQMGEWLNAVEDPAKRLDLYLRAIEYHIPKLGRTEISGPGGSAIQLEQIQRLIVDPANTNAARIPAPAKP